MASLDYLFETGGKPLKLVSLVSGQINAGASGTLISATAGAGQYIKIRQLAINSTSGGEASTTLTIDGVAVFSAKNLRGLGSVKDTGVGFGSNYAITSTTTEGDRARALDSVICTSFSLAKDSGTTANNIAYSYELLEAI